MGSVIGDFGKFMKRRLTYVVCRGEGMDQISTREPSIWVRKKVQILNEEIFLNFSVVTLVHNMHSLLTITMNDYKQTL